MLKSLLRDRKLLILLFIAIVIKLFSLNEALVEQYYTYGFYPLFSRLLRSLFGWIPVSIGVCRIIPAIGIRDGISVYHGEGIYQVLCGVDSSVAE